LNYEDRCYTLSFLLRRFRFKQVTGVTAVTGVTGMTGVTGVTGGMDPRPSTTEKVKIVCV
jgi:hypothetical protein